MGAAVAPLLAGERPRSVGRAENWAAPYATVILGENSLPGICEPDLFGLPHAKKVGYRGSVWVPPSWTQFLTLKLSTAGRVAECPTSAAVRKVSTRETECVRLC